MNPVVFESQEILKEVIPVLVFANQINLCDPQRKEEFESIVDDLNATKDGESCEEAHCPTN